MMVFICSPYRGDTVRNILRAQGYCRRAVSQGHTPFAPHLFFPQFLKDEDPEERALGIQMGITFLDLCDEVWVFGKPTAGMEKEIAYARDAKIPITYFEEDI